MAIEKYTLRHYKCFTFTEIDLNSITLLTGNNGAGKSSVLQGLLLSRIAIERGNHNPSEQETANVFEALVPINELYELRLGAIDQLFNVEAENGTFSFSINEDLFTFSIPNQAEALDILIANCIVQKNSSLLSSLRFYYLNTERLGPRLNLEARHTDFVHCGYKGELTGQVLFRYGIGHKVLDGRAHPMSKSPNLQQQVDTWLTDVCPGTQGVVVKESGVNGYQIAMRTNALRQDVMAPNIGFGISYALPIIVQGLIAEPGSIFVVENPEAHLHPKGQSNIGYFLGLVAAAGVKVIIETHSEHVVNGVRRASLSNIGLLPTDVSIYFFELQDNGHFTHKILQDKNGELDKFPVNFFDQVNQDMGIMYNLKFVKTNG